MAVCKRGKGLLKINGSPIDLLEPEILRAKVYEPILLVGKERFADVDMRVRVKGGGHVSQVYGAFGIAVLCVRINETVCVYDSHPSSHCQSHCCLSPKVYVAFFFY